MNSQDKILIFINDYLTENHYPPSTREIGKAIDLKSTSTVHDHLHVMKHRELITFEPQYPRTISITPKGKKVLKELKSS